MPNTPDRKPPRVLEELSWPVRSMLWFLDRLGAIGLAIHVWAVRRRIRYSGPGVANLLDSLVVEELEVVPMSQGNDEIN